MGMFQNLVNYFTAETTQQNEEQNEIDALYMQDLDKLRLNAFAKSNDCDKIRQQLTQAQQHIIENAKPAENQSALERYEGILNALKQADDSLSAVANDKKVIASIKDTVKAYKQRFEEIIGETQDRSIDFENEVKREIATAGENAALLGITVNEFERIVAEQRDKLKDEKNNIVQQFTVIDDTASVEQLASKEQELLQVQMLQQRLGAPKEDKEMVDNALKNVQEKIANKHSQVPPETPSETTVPEDKKDDKYQDDIKVAKLQNQYQDCMVAYSKAYQMAQDYKSAIANGMSFEQFSQDLDLASNAIFDRRERAQALYDQALASASKANDQPLVNYLMGLHQRYTDKFDAASFLLNNQRREIDLAAHKETLLTKQTAEEKRNFINAALAQIQALKQEIETDFNKLPQVYHKDNDFIKEKNSANKTLDDYEQFLNEQMKLAQSVSYKPPSDSPLIIAALDADKKQALTIEALPTQNTNNNVDNNLDLRVTVKAYVDHKNDADLRYIKQPGASDLVEIGPKGKVQATLQVSKNRIIAEGKEAYGHLLGIAAENPNITYNYKGTETRLKAMMTVFEQQIATETDPAKQKALQDAFNKITFKPDGQDNRMTVAEFKQSLQGKTPNPTAPTPTTPSRSSP